MIPNVPKLTTAALKISSSRISLAPIFVAKSSLNTGFDAFSIHRVLPLPVAMCSPTTKSGIAPKLIWEPWVLPDTAPAMVWPLPIPAAFSARFLPSSCGTSSRYALSSAICMPAWARTTFGRSAAG